MWSGRNYCLWFDSVYEQRSFFQENHEHAFEDEEGYKLTVYRSGDYLRIRLDSM